MATIAAKVCTVCHGDCSDKPRVKDEFNRYTCRACLDARVQGSNAAALQDHDELSNLRAAAQLEAKSAALDLPESASCPKCHNFLPDAARVCMRCGYDRKRGAKVITRVEKVKAETSSTDAKRQALRIYNYVAYAILAICLGIGALSFINVEMAFVCLLACCGILSLVGLTTKVCQVMDGEWTWFIVGWFIGIVDVIWILLNYRTWLKMMLVGSIGGIILCGISLVMNRPE